jgi:hypothetical protein
MATKTSNGNGTGARVAVPENGTGAESTPVVTLQSLEALVTEWANLSSKDGRLFSALCGVSNPAVAVQNMLNLIGRIQTMARTGASKAFTFADSHPFAGMTGRDALNAVTDERESNGKVRTRARDTYKVRK